MKINICFNFFFIFVMFFISSCSEQPSQNNSISSTAKTDKMLIVTTIPPIKFLASEIGRNNFEYISLVNENKSLHDFEPTMQDLVKLNKSALYFTINLPIEKKIVKKVFPKQSNRYCNLANSLKLRKADNALTIGKIKHKHNNSCKHEEKDVHVWLSIDNLVAMTKTLANEFSRLDPKNANTYNMNAIGLCGKLLEIKEKNKQLLLPYKEKTIIVFHSAFGYFLSENGLNQRSIEDNTNHITASDLKKIISEINKSKSKIIYTQPQYNEQHARAISEATGCKIIKINPLAENLFKNLTSMGKAFEKNFIKEANKK